MRELKRVPIGPLSVSFCLWCDWAGTYGWWIPIADVEAMIEDHLDTEHPGWTLESVRSSVAMRGTGRMVVNQEGGSDS